MIYRPTVLVAFAWIMVAPFSHAVAQVSTEFIADVESAVFATSPPGDLANLFVIDQGSSGTANIHVIDKNTKTLDPNPFLTIGGLRTGGEQGLLGLAFHPDYVNNGFFYAYLSVPGGSNHQSEIRRYHGSDPELTQTVLRFNQPFSNHNGGWIGFNPKISPDDPQYLYIATGDGGSGGDPFNNSQDTTNNLLGKMLRVDVDADDFPNDANRNYAIPADNPFTAPIDNRDDEIWSYGLRNPYRNSFDRQSGDLWIGDVGQMIREEIDVQPADSPGGENWGWRVKEGNGCFDNSRTDGNPPCNHPDLLPPIYDYTHGGGTTQGFAVIGGYVYRGSVAQFEGMYFFADHVTHHIWTLDPHAVNVGASVIRRNSQLGTTLTSPSSFGEDADGELYVVSLSGPIERIRTSARQAVWDGNADVGTPGDGSTWGSAENWTRDNVADTEFLSSDEVVFGSSSTQSSIDLGTDRVVSSVRFDDDYRLQSSRLTVLSGNVTVSDGVAATIDADLMAESIHTSVRKLGGGKLLANGNVEQTVVLAGTLGGNASVSNLRVADGAAVAPGNSAGQLTVLNNFVASPGSILEIELGGETSVSEHDLLAVNGRADIDGTVSFQPIDGLADPSVPGGMSEFTFVTGDILQGVFSAVIYDGVALDGGLLPIGSLIYRAHDANGVFRQIRYESNEITLQSYLAVPGDVDGDFTVNAIDFEIIVQNLFTRGTDWDTGDLNGDGFTDVRDLNVWSKHKSLSTPQVSVPEPSSIWQLMGSLGVLVTRRRNKSSTKT